MKREDIQYAFNTAKLQKGDILLINDYEESLRKKMGGAKYTHASLYMWRCSIRCTHYSLSILCVSYLQYFV